MLNEGWSLYVSVLAEKSKKRLRSGAVASTVALNPWGCMAGFQAAPFCMFAKWNICWWILFLWQSANVQMFKCSVCPHD